MHYDEVRRGKNINAIYGSTIIVTAFIAATAFHVGKRRFAFPQLAGPGPYLESVDTGRVAVGIVSYAVYWRYIFILQVRMRHVDRS